MAFKVWQCIELLKSWKFPPPKRPKAFILRASSAASHLFDCLIARGKCYGQKLTKTLLILQPDWSFSLHSRRVFGTMLSVQNHLAWNGTWQRPVCSAWHSCSQGSQTMSWLSKLPDIVQKTSDTCWKTCHDKASFSRFFSISPEGKQAPFLWSTWKTWNKTCHHCDFVSTVPLPWRSLTSSAHRWRAAPQIGYQCFNLWNQMTRGFLRLAVYHFDWKNKKISSLRSIPIQLCALLESCQKWSLEVLHLQHRKQSKCTAPLATFSWSLSQAMLKTVPKAEDPAQSISIPRMTSETNFKEIMNTTFLNFLNAFQRYILRKRPWPGSPVTSDPDPKLKIL